MEPLIRVYIKELKNRDRLLLEEVRFEADAGKIYCILGKNGTGKSTLLKYIGGLLDKQVFDAEGEVIIAGKKVSEMEEKELREFRRGNIRYVFQDAVNSFDPLKKLGYYFKLSGAGEKEIEEELNFFLLPPKEELFKRYPYELSGGMAQRVSFILALLAKPKLLIMDEPTSGTDTPIANLYKLRMNDFIRSGNRTILIVTQDITFAKNTGDLFAFISGRTIGRFSESAEIEAGS